LEREIIINKKSATNLRRFSRYLYFEKVIIFLLREVQDTAIR